ncbi:MAG TPA: thiamine pyrophosphate-dependent enzyme [Hyphomicrobiaceae bacterium]|nr:thiamine pyrophosphate-dependent enzyme [Hyphomicrobiaceae bacterium]
MAKAKAAGKDTKLDRRAVVRELLRDRGDVVVVSGLGSATYDVFAAGDHERNFYLWGAMGGAAMIGFGLALAQPKIPVLVITGDGEKLMGLGSLATIGVQKPKNLTIVVLDNSHYGETGMQASHTGLGVNLPEIARNSGFEWTDSVTTMAGVEAVRARLHRKEATGFVSVAIAATETPRALPSRDGAYIKNRVRAALGFNPI